MAAERVDSFAKLNLSAIKKCDQYVVNIVDNASQVALYKFNGDKQAWVGKTLLFLRWSVILVAFDFSDTCWMTCKLTYSTSLSPF